MGFPECGMFFHMVRLDVQDMLEDVSGSGRSCLSLSLSLSLFISLPTLGFAQLCLFDYLPTYLVYIMCFSSCI